MHTPRSPELPPEVERLIEQGALFVINHSGGKDSQAQSIMLRRIVPARQLLVIHADLGEVEWDGNVEHIRATLPDLPLIVCRNENKTFLSMVEDRRMWPSPKHRQCTSDLKRDPIDREIRRYLKAHPEFAGRIVSCQGIRAEESTERRKKQPWTRGDKDQCAAGRDWWIWYPIFKLTTEEVFASIAAAGEQPHPVYAAGMSRLSCCFCIMSKLSDLKTAAHLRPDLYHRYVETEKRIGHTMAMNGQSLEQRTGITAHAPEDYTLDFMS